MIYFITARDIGRVKIGHAKDPAQRFINLQVGSPIPLTLERVAPGGQYDEARLHLRFSDHRKGGEWFELVEEIEVHMATLPAPTKSARKRIEQADPITTIRRTLGLTQSQFAEKLGVTQSTISRFERGELPLDKRTLLAARSLLSQEGEAA